MEGEGKYAGMLGALVLVDSEFRQVSVGTGFSDYERSFDPDEHFVGKVIEIKYEQIQDTYLQPSFIQVREDKSPKEID